MGFLIVFLYDPPFTFLRSYIEVSLLFFGLTIFKLTEESRSIANDHLLKLLPPVWIEMWQECFQVTFGAVGLHAITVQVSLYSPLSTTGLTIA